LRYPINAARTDLAFTLKPAPASVLKPALDRARIKAYLYLMPIIFFCYVIAYIDRNNVGIAKLTMSKDMPAFTDDVIGLGAGIFFFGYFLLEIPGSLIVEKWSARKWICRIMVTWGFLAAATAFVTTPMQFYGVRFCLGLAEAGFFPGVIVFLTHWFPTRDRARAISMFLVASPVAMIIGPLVSRLMIGIGTTEVIDGVSVTYPQVMGFSGWQWIYIAWGIPAVVLGLVVLFFLPDHPKDAKWLADDERDALEAELASEKASQSRKHMKLSEALRNPNVLLLALAYFGIVTANYGIEIFLPSILESWYQLSVSKVTLLVVLPSILVMIGQLGVGWSSDHFSERRWHASLPVLVGVLAVVATPFTQGNLPLTVICFMIAATGFKSYMPAFWALPSLFLTSTAAAGSVGLINSVGNLGGFLGPFVIGKVKTLTGSYENGLYFLAITSAISTCIIIRLKIKDDKA
jgi:MFS transporter, ACS family, tartrate transporter